MLTGSSGSLSLSLFAHTAIEKNVNLPSGVFLFDIIESKNLFFKNNEKEQTP